MWQHFCLEWCVKLTKICTGFRVNTSVFPSLEIDNIRKGIKMWGTDKNHKSFLLIYSNGLVHLCNSHFLQPCETPCLTPAGSELWKISSIEEYFSHKMITIFQEWFRHLWSEWLVVNKITEWAMMNVKLEIAMCSCGKLVRLVIQYCMFECIFLTACATGVCIHEGKGHSFILL